MNDTPYLSVVATSRNDDHGGNLVLRMQLFVRCLAAQAQRHRLKAELIVVEWNPPADRPRLREVLSCPARHPFCSVRIIEVPATIHARYRHAQTLPIYQMIAKNVGIRRARGRFVLATNVDIVFSDSLFARLAGRNLESGRCYRSVRHDADNALTSEMPVEVVLDYCKDHLVRVNHRDYSLNVRDGSRHIIYHPGLTEAQLGQVMLFTNGCGDFTLLSYEDWCRLRGYAELDMFSFHLDSLLLYCAHYAGIKEHVFPDDHVHYHIEHQEGWIPEIHRDRTLDARLKEGRIDRLDDASLWRLLDRMRSEQKPLLFNKARWGLADDRLAEERVTVADWERAMQKQPRIAAGATGGHNGSKDGLYLSLVVTTRNDDHGGNHLHRFQVFLDHVADMCARHSLAAELIVVEWNPDASRPSLAEAMRWPAPSRLATRVIVVPPEIHRAYRNCDKFPLFQMIAKNVGIRRARGEYVLATNVDILFSDELTAWLARRELREDCVYRIDRHDVGETTIPQGLSCDEVIEFCARHVVRVQGMHGTHVWGEPPRVGDPSRLHTNACGDFTLMARRQWERLKGYVEFPLWSIYLDGLLLHATRAVGLEQRILREPLRIYHIEHSLSWAVTQDTVKERPSLDFYKEYRPLCQEMQRTRKALEVNSENWGLKDRALVEYEPGVRDPQAAPARCAAGGRPDGLPNELVHSSIDRISSTENRLYYRDQSAQAVVALARCRELTRARDVLGRIVQNGGHPRCRRLFDDLVTWVGPGKVTPSRVPRRQSEDGGGMTLFAMPKPFAGHIATIQKNAIRSWARLNPAPQIILFGDEPGIREMAEEIGAGHIPQVDRNEFGTPLVNKLFKAAEAHASHTVLAYVNADMILFQSFVEGVQKVRTRLSTFLLIGQRWDIPILDEIDFRQPRWQWSLQKQMEEHAMLHAECGLDYFVFPKGLYREIPPFAIGRTVWDNWLVMAPHTYGAAVVDGTEFITAVHQDHDYGHVAGGRQEAWKGVEAARNRELIGTIGNSGRASGATWILNAEGELLQTPPREPCHLTTRYRDERVAWLLEQAEWLMTAGRSELAACKWEESLGHQEALITVRRSSDSPHDSAENTRLVHRYAITCVSLAQCHAQMGHYERAAGAYSRLLENRKISIPETQRKKFTQQRDEWTRVIRKDDVSAAAPATVPCQNAVGDADIHQGGASSGRRSGTGAGSGDERPEPGQFADAAAARVVRPRPKVTVVTACHDAEPHLAECLDSILCQTLAEWELLLLDDGSTDGTRRIMEDCAARDARIRPFFFDDNAGPYVRRNFAIERADAPFIVIQDADDVMCPEKLERLYHAITQDDRLGVVGSFYHMFLDKYQGVEHCETVVLTTTHEQILEEYRTSAICDFCWHGSAIIRKQMFADIGPYDQNPFASDSYWLAKVAEYACRSDEVRLMNIPDVLTLRRMHVGSQTGSLPAFDPRSRRAQFREYRREKLSEVIRQLDFDPRGDVKALLRRAVCSDFIEKNGRLFAEWERAPLTPRMVQSLIGRICTHFTSRQFVRCIVTSQIVEQLVEGIAQNVRSYDLVKALAYFALGYPRQARECLDRECHIHGTPEAAWFRTEWLDRDDGRWTRAERVSAIEKGIFLGDPGEPTRLFRCLLEHGAKGPTGLSVILSLAADAMPWAEMLASFNAQTEKDFEVIALTRETAPDGLASLADRIGFRLTVFEVGHDAGWSTQHNAAAKRAEGRYVAFLGEHVLPDRDFVRCTLQHIRQTRPSGLRGRILCEGKVSRPIRFDLGPDMRHAACDIDELCVFDKETFFRLGGFPAMPFDHGAIQLSCRIYADPHEGRRPILYCPDVVGRYRGPDEPRAGYVDRFVLENRFAIGQLMQSHCLREDQEPEAWSFLMFVRGTGLTNTWTEDERYEQYLQNSLFFRKRNPRLAIEWAEKTLEGHPDSIKAKCVLGSAYTLLGRSADACVCLEGILAPLEQLLAWERLDCAQREFHDYGYIVECYVGACTRLAECYMETGRYDRVADIYARLLENRHVRLEPAQRQSMERVRDRLTHSVTEVTEATPSRAVGPGLNVTPVNRNGARMNKPEVAEAPVGRRPSEDEALDERRAQVLAELERKYRSMPSGAPGKHAVAVRLSELFRRAGRTSKSKALEIEARTIGNTLAFEKARPEKPAVCSHRPVIVEFNVITRCNGGCIMCSYGTDGEIIDLGQFKRLADEWLPTARDAHLVGGEVLLHPQFYDLCEYANRFGVSLGMTTNLSTLAGARAEAIQRFFNTVRVSVDGATRQTYESIRTRLGFDRLCQNLEVLADIRRGKPDLELELAFVAMRQNIAELPAVIEMASRYAFDSVAVNFVQAYSAQALDDSLLFHRELANTHFDLARAQAARLGLVLDIPNNFDLSRKPYMASEQLTEGHKQCVRPWQQVRVLINGDVITCCHLHDLPMGNALTESLEHVWNGERSRGLRRAIKESCNEMPERCKRCRILMRGADSNDAMLHVGPGLVSELRQRLHEPSDGPSVAVAGAAVLRSSAPKVTVVTTCRNGELYLAECLESIQNQTLSEWELFLLDDGSTDGTRRIIEAYAARDSRIRPFCFDDSAGPYIRRNFAIRQSSAPFVVIQDADDIMCADKLQRLREAIVEDERLGVIGSFYRSFLDEFTGTEHTEAVTLPTTHEQILEVYQTQLIWDFLWHGSAIIRRDLFDAIGLYDENPFGADSFWLAKVAEYACHTGRIRLRTIPEFLTLRRVHGDSQTGLLPTMDPRSRRVGYVEYCLEKLKEVANRATHDPRVDLARALRECTCGDFLQQRGDQAAAREHQPVDDRAVDHLLQRALQHFRERRYVTCVRTLRGLETMDATIPRRVANFDLVRAIALCGLGQKERSRIYLRRERVNHDSAMAGQWHEDIFERGMQIDVPQWYAEHADTLTLRITDAIRSEPSPAADDRTRTTAGRPPKVTVVTACRNAGRFLAECVESVLGQTLGEWELFLLDDGSTDDTRRIIEEYRRRDGRIQAYCFDEQKGPYVRRNFAIDRARADFIVIQDADDIMCPTKLEILHREIRCDDMLAMVGSDYRTFLEEYCGPEYSEIHRLPQTNDEILGRFKFWQHGMSHGSAIIRKALFAAVGLYDENPFAADSFWSAKLALYAEAGKPVVVKNVPECLTLIRLHATNPTRVLSTLDPRNRRVRYGQYCESKLWRIRDRLKSQPDMDIGRELRQCTCGDFLVRFKARILAWESQPLDDRVVPELLRSAVWLFHQGYYISCADVLNGVESFEPAVADRMVGYDLLRGLAFFAMQMKERARLHLDREIRRHDNPAARQFVEDAFGSAAPVDVPSWCQKHAERFNTGLMEAKPRRSPATTLSVARA